MFKLSPLVRMSSGLVFVTISILLLADLIGFIPNHTNLIVDERRKLAELITIQIMKSVELGQEQTIPASTKTIIERNEDILSAAIRLVDGTLLMEYGEHQNNWKLAINDSSTTNAIQVPVSKQGEDWARIEIRYKSLNITSEFFGFQINDFMLLTGFVGLMGYIFYGLFLRRTLKQLDPKSVIPDRVRNAMNALSEGVLILDKKEKIMLANQSICEKIGIEEKKLIGKEINKLAWRLKSAKDKNILLPWKTVLNSGESVSSIALSIDVNKQESRTFMVNSSPVEGDNDSINGVLCTFDDVTYLEKKNKDLQSALSLLKKTQEEIYKKNEELSLLASTDPLTECFNRRAFFEIVNKEYDELDENNTLACIMLDIDFFKKVNDVYGHTVGDTVIRAMADTLKNNLRKSDLLCRYGGEEFCVVLLSTSVKDAYKLAEVVRKKVEDLKFLETPATENMTITASFGITDTTFGAVSLEALIDQADQALYFSKENGRNCASSWEDVISQELTNDDSSQEIIKASETETRKTQSDALTGLPGRQNFINIVRESIAKTNNSKGSLGIILIDIDMFNRVNASLGTAQGDMVLQQFAQRLSSFVRESDALAYFDQEKPGNSPISRLGGNTFSILASDFRKSSNIHILAKRFLETLSEPYIIDDTEVHLSLSAGISLYPADGNSVDTLIHNAELALFRAKQEEGNTYRRYVKEIDLIVKDTISIENELRDAIRNKEFIVYYQPKINLVTNSVDSVEALVRWQHPEKGLIPPGLFIPIAENSGLTNEIGRQVMDIAFQQAVRWVNEGYTDLRVSINVSPLQLKKDDFVKTVLQRLKLYSCSPHNIEFELTETVLIDNIDMVVPILKELNAIGIKFSIDDFGVGYSSLNYIKRLPVDIIKIDKSFIDHIHTKEEDATLVAAIIAMAHAMNLTIVAEGVEERAQLQILKKLKSDYVQGFYFSKPIPADRISILLQKNQAIKLAHAN